MFLKSLTLKGFKSFADVSTLEFEPGVTVVVGPNGSGKSNIVDAVAWVLGAQGPRALRSSKMEDVIFAGTAKRPALGRAEVSLTIDNSAGILPIDFTEVKVTRALWRNGDSEYSINGAPCRLLDVQELLSDTGVGRQQHTIISQAQLDSILAARPEDRRAVIEEAAGVSKHRRRKEKAERRLEATEGALVRAQDLLREVRRQLRPLERQADAARRYAGLTEELAALRRHLYGREFSALGSRLAIAASQKDELRRSAELAESSLAGLDASVVAAEATLDAQRERSAGADLSEAVSTAEGLKGRASGLLALVAERSRSIEREREAGIDKDVVSSLEAEAASLVAELAAAEREAADLLPLEEELVSSEGALARDREALEAAQAAFKRPSTVKTSAERLAEVRAELAALRKAGSGEQLGAVEDRASTARARLGRLLDEAERALAEREMADERAEDLERRAVRAAALLGEAEEELARAREERRDADAARHRWSARAEALAQALDEARARAGARRLAGVEGVVGALVELVDVDEGLEAAFEAAAGEALSAVLMAGEGPARDGLERLNRDGAHGAVIALGQGVSPGMAAGAQGDPRVEQLPPGASWLRGHVRSVQEDVGELLDGLLRTAVVAEGGWEEALGLAISHQELVVVTKGGDRFSGGIWRVGAHGTGATGAALAEARAALSAAESRCSATEEAEREAQSAVERARVARREAQQALESNSAARAAAARALARVRSDIAEALAGAEAIENERAVLAARLEAEVARTGELEGLLPGLEAAAGTDEAEARRLVEARDQLASRQTALATLRRDLEVRATGIEERRGVLERRRAEVERRLEGHLAEREAAGRRRVQLDAAKGVLDQLKGFVAARLEVLEKALARLREQRKAETEALRAATQEVESRRRERASLERELLSLRERLAQVELEESQLKARAEVLTESVRRDLDCEPEALAGEECPDLPAGTSPAARARELERELRLMGPINPLALEEYAALEERHGFLESQLHDVSSARRELAKVIKAVDAEIITVFQAAYEDVVENFAKLVDMLFPGGQGKVFLSDASNILESGVDLEVRPMGKKVNRMSLLSGGERSLVALAFLFAVFRSRPSPFYMLDEVEAALDDVSLHRFLDLVHEFRDEAQLLIVSHQKRTMEAADCLYGVSMAPAGSSVVVSQKLDRPQPGETRPAEIGR